VVMWIKMPLMWLYNMKCIWIQPHQNFIQRACNLLFMTICMPLVIICFINDGMASCTRAYTSEELLQFGQRAVQEVQDDKTTTKSQNSKQQVKYEWKAWRENVPTNSCLKGMLWLHVFTGLPQTHTTREKEKEKETGKNKSSNTNTDGEKHRAGEAN